MNLKEYQSMPLEQQLAYINERLEQLKADGKKSTDYDTVYAGDGLQYRQIYKVLYNQGYRVDKSMMQFVLKQGAIAPVEVAATTTTQQEEEMVVAQDTIAPTLTASEIEQLRALLAKANPMSFEGYVKDHATQKFVATTVRVRETVLNDWNEFCKAKYGYYNQSDVLTAALAEFMDKYGHDGADE